MDNEIEARRTFLKMALLSSACVLPTAADVFKVAGTRTALPPVKIAVNGWLCPQIVEDIQNLFLNKAVDLRFEYKKVSTFEKWSEIFRHNDALITAPHLHVGELFQEHLFFGALPFGKNGEDKLAWLRSGECREFQTRYFGFLGLVPTLVASGPDHMGLFSHRRDLTKIQLSQGPIASGGVQAQWFRQRGLRTVAMSPSEQVQNLNSRRLEASNIYTPSVLKNMTLHLGKTIYYHPVPLLKTAPTIFVLWKADAWKRVTSASAGIHTLSDLAFAEISRRWREREMQALADIKRDHVVQPESREFIETFWADAAQYHEELARPRQMARELAQAYRKYSSLPRPA